MSRSTSNHRLFRLLAVVHSQKDLIALFLLYGAALLFLCLVTLIPLFDAEITLTDLTRDTVATLQGHRLTGLVSNMGIVIWATSASICFFSYKLYSQSHSSSRLTQFFFWSGLFTFLLLMDDLFLLHEESSFLPIPKELPYLLYLSILLLYLSRFRKILFKKQSALFWLSLLFFAFSVLIDFAESSISRTTFIEDCFKFLGIVSWAGFLIKTSFQEVTSSLNSKQENQFSGVKQTSKNHPIS